VDWFNHRLLKRIGNMPPAEAEEQPKETALAA
jgi:hypothetical protein